MPLHITAVHQARRASTIEFCALNIVQSRQEIPAAIKHINIAHDEK
ncbi:MAG: hypothetical protein LLG02_07960 [Pelosinus sp.]|nr:hypothetical protein [Pelosinus sp.]